MPVERPFVDRPVSDLDRATGAARAAASAWRLPAPSLVRRGMNALYVCDRVVLRVGSATAAPALAHELVRMLAAHGVATVRPADGWAASFDGFAVTAWERVDVVDAPIDWRAVGAMVRRVHELSLDEVPAGYPVPVPTAFPWWDFDALLADVGGEIDDGARAGLAAAVERHRSALDEVAAHPVVCHGDVHPGNVLVSAAGPLLVDWDLLCRADPVWDHAMLTTYATRWGGDPDVYPAFADGYGRSLADEPLTIALGELRNVAATLMRVRAARGDRAAANEAERRLRYWRGDRDAPAWHAQ